MTTQEDNGYVTIGLSLMVEQIKDRDAEIVRLRALVEDAYREGYGPEPDVDRDWIDSATKRKLDASK